MAAEVDWEAFTKAISDPDTNPADLIAKLISDVVAQFSAHAATITDPVELAEFNRVQAKTVSELEGQLSTFQTSFDEVQTKRRVLKKQIDAQTEVVVTQSIRELEDL